MATPIDLPEGDMDAIPAPDLCDRAMEARGISDQIRYVSTALGDQHADGLRSTDAVIRAALTQLRAARKSLDALVAGLEGGL